MRYPLWLTTALLVGCAGAGQANEALNQAQTQAAQMQAAQMQAAQLQYQSQAYMAAAQQQAQQAQMPALAGFAGAGAMPQGAGDAAQMAQYFMPSTYAGYAGYNPYAYMYSGYGNMGYYPYYGGMPQQQQPIVIQAPAPQPKQEEPKIIEKIVEVEKAPEAPKVVTPPAPLAPREIIRIETKTVPERASIYLGASGTGTLWSPMSYMLDYANDGNPFDKSREDALGLGGQVVLGVDCCSLSARSDLGMRFEGEFGWNQFRTDDVTLTNTGASMSGTGPKNLSATMWSGAVNGYLEYKTGAVHPYIGGGVGGALGLFNVNNTDPQVDFRDGTYMAQAMAGVSVDISKHLAGNVGYRFRHYGELGDYDVGDAYKWRLGLEEAHTIEAGLRIKF